jgi:metal iron transporter
MAPSHLDAVGHVNPEISAIDTAEKCKVEPNEKTRNTEVVELQDVRQKSMVMGDFAHSFSGAFSKQRFRQYAAVMVKFGKFMGPGAIVSVAYIDPDNYQTSVSSGVAFEYKLLFMVLISNLIAVFLQVS